MDLIQPILLTSVLSLGSLLMNGNAHEFLSTGCRIFPASDWREHGGAVWEEMAPSCLQSLIPGGLTWSFGALWPTQWQRAQALSPASLHLPLDFSGAIRAWASFCSWQRGSRNGCEHIFLSELWSKFLCLHFKTNCDVCMPSATLNFISRMHVLANIVLIPRDGSQTLPFVEWLLPLLHGSCTGPITFWVAKAHTAWKNSLQYYWGNNFLKNKMPECKLNVKPVFEVFFL